MVSAKERQLSLALEHFVRDGDRVRPVITRSLDLK